MHVELLVDMFDVVADRLVADEELPGDLLIVETENEMVKDFQFS